MKRTIFTLVGFVFLSSITFVSCIDKLFGDDSNSGGEDGMSPYRTVTDSTFYYRDGAISKMYSFYDSEAKPVREIILEYDADGNIITNQEGTYSYKKYIRLSDEYLDADYSITYNNNGLRENTKTEVVNSVQGNSYSSIVRKEYVYHDGKWLLINENYMQRDKRNNYVYNGKDVKYGIYNGEIIVVSRSESEQTQDSSGEVINTSNSYSKSCTYDNTNSGGIYSRGRSYIIRSIGNGSWSRSIRSWDAKGRQLRYNSWRSNDSINWEEYIMSDIYEYVYKDDAQGNLVEEIRKDVDGNDLSKIIWVYDSKNRLLKEQCFVRSDKEKDLVLDTSVDYKYSESSKLISIEINTSVVINYSGSGYVIGYRGLGLPQRLPVNESGKIIGFFSSIDGYPIGDYRSPELIGAKCIITCDSNGYPVRETLYKTDSDGNLVENGRCNIEYDLNGNLLSYVVKQLEDGEWKEVISQQSTYDSDGHQLSSYSKSVGTGSGQTYKSGYPYTYISYTSKIESESRMRAEYNTLGYNSYYYSGSSRHEHRVYSDGQIEDIDSEVWQEQFYSTIKVN
jgi:hypothetical protein